MHRFFALLAAIGVFLAGLIAGLIATTATSTIAQDATPSAFAGHPVVGAWHRENVPGTVDAHVSYGVFHADGTYVEAHPLFGTGIGTWTAGDERTAELVIVFQDIDDDPNRFEPGVMTVRQSIAIDETGATFTAQCTLEANRPDGTVAFTVDFTSLGTRLPLDASAGTPGVGTPTP